MLRNDSRWTVLGCWKIYRRHSCRLCSGVVYEEAASAQKRVFVWHYSNLVAISSICWGSLAEVSAIPPQPSDAWLMFASRPSRGPALLDLSTPSGTPACTHKQRLYLCFLLTVHTHCFLTCTHCFLYFSSSLIFTRKKKKPYLVCMSVSAMSALASLESFCDVPHWVRVITCANAWHFVFFSRLMFL